MKLKVNKLPILIPIALVAVLLVALAVSSVVGRDNAQKHTDLGKKHLDDGNYTLAVTEFLQSLSIDPTSEDARLGLAKARVAAGALDQAEEVLRPLLDAEYPDAYRLLAESFREADPMRALGAADALVSKTDTEDDHKLVEELLAAVMGEGHSFAEGTDQALVIADGKVCSRGKNTFGQLGVSQGIGLDSATDVMTDAGFPGVPKSVYCAGRTSLVVDEAGNLWAAGENRWGQQGNGAVLAGFVAGWSKIADDVASASGETGAIFILKRDGTLWYSGQGGVTSLSRITNVGRVISVASTSKRTAVLAADGTLYVNRSDDPSSFSRYAANVKCFTISEGNGLFWVTADKEIVAEYSMYSYPSTWTWAGSGILPDFTVTDLADTGGELLLLKTDGTLMRLAQNSAVTQIDSDVVSVYSTACGAVIQYRDGTAALWKTGAFASETAK